MMSDPLIDDRTRELSEMSDERLDAWLGDLERAYVHALIERSLRGDSISPTQSRVSNIAKRIRGE